MRWWRRKPSMTMVPPEYVHSLIVLRLLETVNEYPGLAQGLRTVALEHARKCVALLSPKEMAKVSGNILRFRGLKR